MSVLKFPEATGDDPLLQCTGCGSTAFKCYIDTAVICAKCDHQIRDTMFIKFDQFPGGQWSE